MTLELWTPLKSSPSGDSNVSPEMGTTAQSMRLFEVEKPKAATNNLWPQPQLVSWPCWIWLEVTEDSGEHGGKIVKPLTCYLRFWNLSQLFLEDICPQEWREPLHTGHRTFVAKTTKIAGKLVWVSHSNSLISYGIREWKRMTWPEVLGTDSEAE